MQEFQQRVVQEKAELDDKISKLNAFFGSNIFHHLGEIEQLHLRHQFRAMSEYSTILGKRIALFEG